MQPPTNRPRRYPMWLTPLTSVVFGLIFLAAQWANHHLGQGLVDLAIMVSFALVILLGGRSETIRGLRGDGRDERFATIDVRATAFTGLVLVVAVVAGVIVEVARNHSGAPFSWLAAVGGLAYLGSVVWLRVRS